MTVRLESWYRPERGGRGWFRIRVVNAGPDPVPIDAVAFQSVVALTPAAGPASLVERTSGHHVLALPAGTILAAGAVLELGDLACGHRPGHANDGPVGAYLISPGGDPVPARSAVTGHTGPDVGVVPAWSLARPVAAGDDVADAWAVAAALEARLIGPASAVLGGGDTPTTLVVDDRVGAGFVVTTGDDGIVVRAGTPSALTSGLAMLARRVHEGRSPDGAFTPRWSWRGLHVDLARQFFPGADVLDLIDIAAWHGLDRLHLHLTDDESWRVAIPGFPALTEIGGVRGHGRPIPPLLGSGPGAYGGWYTDTELAAWVERSQLLGVELVPEVDVPGHSFAARAALPALVDPADATVAASVQHFTGNVLDPGLPATWDLLDTVFGSLADRFPGRVLHLGGDEVPAGAWAAAPAARAWGAARDATDPAAIGVAFVRELVTRVAASTGRTIGVWQEAAEHGAVAPGEALVFAWRGAAAVRRLAAAGHDVVATPADVYYLDMAVSPEWYEPGTSWAGSTSVEAVASFEPGAGWDAGECERLHGIQAALWTEHVPDRPTLDRLLHPRLAVVADAAWRRDDRSPGVA